MLEQNAFRCRTTFKVRVDKPGWQSGNALASRCMNGEPEE